VQTFAASILPSFAFNKDAFPNRLLTVPAGPNHSPAETRSGFCAWSLKRNIRLSFALRSRAAQLSQPSRSTKPACWNLSPGRAL